MSNCSQNFRKIFQDFTKKGAEGGNIFSPFLKTSDTHVEVENEEAIIEKIASKAIEVSAASSDNISFYDYVEAKVKLQELTKNYPLLSDSIIDNIIDSIKLKINSNSDAFLTNPLVEVDGNKVPMFDFKNLSKLTGGIEAMEMFIEKELENGLFKTIFINNVSKSEGSTEDSDTYEKFVVTNLALNKNLNIYKNELWNYIVKASGLTAADIQGSKLYINGKLNDSLFAAKPGQLSPYVRVLSSIKAKMESRFASSEAHKHIKIYSDNGISVSQAYLKMLILANFDNFVLSKHANKVALNLNSANSFLLPDNGASKYKLTFKWSKAISIDNSENDSDISKNSSSLVSMLANIIPYYESTKSDLGKARWVRSKEGLTLGKANFDAVGAVLNSIDPNFKITISIRTKTGFSDIELTVGEAFKRYDRNEASFNSILLGLLNATEQNDNLKSIEKGLKSIERFLYGDNGIANSLTFWKEENPNLADFVVNPEIAIINAIRNTVKNKYRTETLKEPGKTLDVLDLESTVGKDFSELVSNLDMGWKTKTVTADLLDTINSADDFINFLTAEKRGGIILSEKAKEHYRSLGIDFTSINVKNAVKRLLDRNASGVKEEVEDPNEASLFMSYNALDNDSIVEQLRSQGVNDNLKLIELFKFKHYTEKYSTVTQVKDANSNSLPTMGIANLASLFNISLAEAPKNSFFKENPKLYAGIEILSEVVGKDSSIKVNELYHNESFKLSFNRHFLMSSINDKKILIQPWNYSDKPKIFGVAIDINAPITGQVNAQGQNKILGELNSTELQEELFNRQQQYYNKLVGDIFDDFKILDKAFFDKLSKAGTSFSTPLNKIEAIEKFFVENNTKSKLFSKVNKLFNENKYVELVEDLHYSVYGDNIHFNQNLKSNVAIFNNAKHFNKWVELKETKLLEFLDKEIKIGLKEITLKNTKASDNTKLKTISKYFNLPVEEIFDTKESKKGKEYTIKNTNEDGKLSEVYSRFLWSRNLVISQYANLTTKDAFFHPAKIRNFTPIDLNTDEGWAQYNKEENLRSVTFTKRMNIPGASMTIYGRGKHGISPNIKIAIESDPKGDTFNFLGEKHTQDVTDGGGKTNPFFNEVAIWSLQGMDLKRTQKPIGESITGKSATTLKFAIFAITNEEVRNSMFAERSSYTMMKKMNSFSIYNTDRNGQPIYEDIMNIIDPSNESENNIDITTSFDNLWVPFKGKNYKLSNLEWIPGTNKYTRVLSRGTDVQEDEVTINNLFDLWEAFGGAYSSNRKGDSPVIKDSDVFIPSEDSIKLVGSVIKKHSLVESSLDLKNKMIAMLLPQTAVKKGATNINNAEDVYHPDKNLSYFNFDTSFFGIQLDTYHSTDESETNEITQVISGIAENASTPELYNAIYDSIGTLVKNGLTKFGITVEKEEGVTKIIDLFIKKLNNSSQINNSRVIINGITEGLSEVIPLGNKTIYKQFVSHIISSINLDYIRRKFSGTGSVLNPSYGVVKVFEDKNGRKYLAPDLLKFALANPTPEFNVIDESSLSEFEKNKAKIAIFLENSPFFGSEPIEISEIEPLDFIKLDGDVTINKKQYLAGEIISLNNIDDFFTLKGILRTTPMKVTRSYGQSRDLKPVVISYIIQGETARSSVFSSDSLEFSWWLNNNKKSLLANGLEDENKMFTDFKNYVSKLVSNFEELDKSKQYDLLKVYSTRWVNRTFDLLSAKKTFNSYEAAGSFDTLFSYTDSEGIIQKEDFTARFEPSNIYAGERGITDYQHKRAENIHSNVHKSSFQLENAVMSDVDERYFLKTIKDFSNIRPKGVYDLHIANSNTKESINIVLDEGKYIEKNNKLYNKAGDEVASKIYINEQVEPNGDLIRLSTYGEKMYKLPGNYSMFKDKDGNEILFIKTPQIENLKKFLERLDSFDIIRFNDYNDFVANIGSDRENDKLINLIEAVSSVTSNDYLRKYFRLKLEAYNKFKKDHQGLEYTKLRDAYQNYLKTEERQIFDNYVSIMGKVMYNSWLFSNKSLSARIPAQAMQSFQSMDTVGYISGDANDVYVSHWQLWLQGSDFDIDKLYMMMYEFKNGMFMGWSPFFDILQPELSFKLPIPTGVKYKWVDSTEKSVLKPFTVAKTEIQNGEEKIIQIPIEPTDLNTLDIDQLDFKGNNLKLLITVLETLNKNSNILYIKSKNRDISSQVNQHNSFTSDAGFKNFIVSKLLETSDHPSNQVASYSPISFGVYEDIKKKLADEYSLSLYDGHTMFMQQEQNSIGKKVIGIAATGLKNYFGLIKYYSDYYNTVSEIKPTDNTYFLKQFTLNGKEYVADKISGLNIKKSANTILKAHLKETLNQDTYRNRYTGEKISTEEVDKIIDDLTKVDLDKDAALNISSILSLATDNAKELMLAKINAGIDFAAMHIYLSMLGVDEETVATFMTSTNAKAIKAKLGRDFFTGIGDSSVPVKLNSLVTKEYREYKKALIALSNAEKALDKTTAAAIAGRISDLKTAIEKEKEKTGIDQEFLAEFIRIYTYAGELTSLGSIFKVNQGSKANQEDLYRLANQFQRIISIQENNYFRNAIFDVNKDLIEQKTNFIIEEKPYLSSKIFEIKRILETMDEYNKENKGLIDALKYFEDPAYRTAVTDYYNLIKGTFNIFDVLNNLPHFYQMFKAFIIGEKFLLDQVNKYKFLKEGAARIIEKGSSKGEIDTNTINKNTRIIGSKNNPVEFSNNLINSINDYYDGVIISKFVKGLNYEINLRALLEYLGLTEINLLEDNKTDIKEQTVTIDNLPYESIDLSTEFGIAQFRYLMENYIIKHEKEKHSSNGFLKQYVFTSHMNYNLKNKINFYLDRSNFSELEALQIGMSLLVNDSNSSEKSYNLNIRKLGDKLDNFKLIDLLSLYDLIVNEGRFGGNRATIFFSKDISEETSLARRFIEFQREQDSSKSFLSELEDGLMANEDQRKIMYLKIFGGPRPGDKTKSSYAVLTTDSEGQVASSISVNRYFSILDTAASSVHNPEVERLSQVIINLIKNKDVNIKIDCK